MILYLITSIEINIFDLDISSYIILFPAFLLKEETVKFLTDLSSEINKLNHLAKTEDNWINLVQ